jgi:hypothetical protein
MEEICGAKWNRMRSEVAGGRTSDLQLRANMFEWWETAAQRLQLNRLQPRHCSTKTAAQRLQLKRLQPRQCSPDTAAQRLQPRHCSPKTAAQKLQPKDYSPETAAQTLQPKDYSPDTAAQRPISLETDRKVRGVGGDRIILEIAQSETWLAPTCLTFRTVCQPPQPSTLSDTSSLLNSEIWEIFVWARRPVCGSHH